MSKLSKQTHPKRVRLASAADFLAGGGEMGERIRNFNWGETSLGPVESWPQSLMTAVRIMLTSRQPIWLGWGEELIKLYNDPYKAIVGGKHPTALGQPIAVVWREIWEEIAPMLETAMGGVEGTYVEEQLLIMERNGYAEETYYTFSYSPIPNDQGGVGGIICANTDDTQRVIGERQLALLRELAVKTADARTVESACALSAECLAINPYDLPFAMIYLVEQDGARVVLAGRGCGIEGGRDAAPEAVRFDDALLWPFAEVLATNRLRLLSDLNAISDKLPDGLPTGAWDRPPHQAVILPIPAQGRTGTAGLLVVGLNPYRLFDDKYRGFLELVARQIAGSLANAQAYEQERKRAEALAELDRVKTAFFSNVSHEFRTPLTLMLGPLEDLLRKADGTLPTPEREQLETAHRNSLRLLKLVNTLLDFSRLEAGRIQAAYQPTDLAAFTAELASVFRSAIERAGLEIVIDCPPLAEPVCIDREMWEKIVFNLLSNAFKFTFAGKIEVSLRATAETAELIVRDTGTGIPAGELPHLFERFHRVRGARGRSIEGSGIGLALVQELVKLNGGAVRVESKVGHGSVFIITLPLGQAHLPADRISTTRKPEPVTPVNNAYLNAYLDEMLGWLPTEAGGEPTNEFPKPAVPSLAPNGQSIIGAQTGPQSRILLADDNADMRDYVRRLLSRECEVVAVADGAQALRAAREQTFDLVLTDVMMPELDGFGLLKALRADERLKTLPVIVLSARAGEEARVEGAAAGADDYLVKPFSARELMARVATHLELSRVRKAAAESLRENEERLHAIFESSAVGFAVLKPDTSFEDVNDAFCAITGYAREELLRMQCARLSPPEDATRTLELYRQLLAGERPSLVIEKRYLKKDGTPIWVLNSTSVTHDAANRPLRLVIVCQDITERKHAEQALRNSQKMNEDVLDSMTAHISVLDKDGTITLVNKSWRQFALENGADWTMRGIGVGVNYLEVCRTAQGDNAEEAGSIYRGLQKILSGESCFFSLEYPCHSPSAQRWFLLTASPLTYESGGAVVAHQNITERRLAEEALRASEARFRFLDKLTEATQGATNSASIMTITARMLGEHLGVSLCAYADVEANENEFTVRRNWRATGVWDLNGTYRLNTFGSQTADQLRAGRLFLTRDVVKELGAAQATPFLAFGLRAIICFPLIKAGRLTAMMAVACNAARNWTADEIALVGEVTERSWAHIERVRSEEALRESEERFRNMADHAPVMIWVTESDGYCSYLSKSWYEFTGQTTDEGLGFGWLNAIHPDDRLRAEEIFAAATERREAFRIDYRLQQRDGEYRWAIDSATPRFELDGQFRGYIGSVIDITERKEMEDALKEADRRKDEFLAMLAHELRNPLAPIRNAAQVLKLIGPTDSNQRWAREVIERQTQHLTRLVDDLLEVSRITQGKVTIARQPLDLTAIINSAVETSRPLIEARRHQLTVALPTVPVRLEGDLTRLVQVIGNLLNNAAKYTDEAGHIRLEAALENNEAVICVEDDGIGISADLLPHVFDLFTQADRSLDRSQGGLGIGLTLVRNLVELHGGRVEAHSEGSGRGSQFIVRLPALPATSKTDDPSQSGETTQNASPGLKVLIVEDSRDSAEMMAFVLKLGGHQVRIANDGAEALEAAPVFQPQAVLCDIGLPGMNGYEVAAHLRRQPYFARTTLIALTGYGQEDARRRAKEAGFDYHLVKPLDPDALVSLLDSLHTTGRES